MSVDAIRRSVRSAPDGTMFGKAAVGALVAALDEAEGRADGLQATFDLRWKADMRAIKMWQDAHPGKELVWPDHADLVVWLLDLLDEERLHRDLDRAAEV